MICDKEPYISRGGWITLNSYIDYKVSGDMVTLKIKEIITNSTGYSTIGTLPEGTRPSMAFISPVLFDNYNGSTRYVSVLIDTDGTVQSHGNVQSGGYVVYAV